MVLKRKKDYEEAREDYAWRLLAEVSLFEARFEEDKAYIFEAIGLVESEERIESEENEGTPYQSSTPIALATHFPEGDIGTTTLGGTIVGVDMSLSQKIWKIFQALGNIAFAYTYSVVLIEI
ncbi:GDP-L-galactose phosphorylase 1-like [Canna indica]|uniref:GDP-L-galactose phosphorylase 1-like n=1 Tax=Canna indica TaxID=4628 RepID=A0AAQ3QDB2_9LILI|nr:GDP-L-galactose phosphorylase 1-like [Canna indica]